MSIRSSCDNCPNNPKPITLIGDDGSQFKIKQKDQRIKELESAVLDLQSELSRKKMSLTVACNRVEELEDRLTLAIGTLKSVKRYLPMWGIDTVMDTLKDLGVE